MKGKRIMPMGADPSVGKSLLCTVLLRIMKQDGLRACPFKAQNMALSISAVTSIFGAPVAIFMMLRKQKGAV